MSLLVLAVLASPAAATGPGATVRLPAEVEGRVVVLNFWASWCAPCRTELPLLEALHGRLDAEHATVLAANLDERPARARALLARLGAELPVAWDARPLAAQLEPPAMPTTFLVDRDGTIRQVWSGELDEEEVAAIEAAVRDLLE